MPTPILGRPINLSESKPLSAEITISVVSHGQASLVNQLLMDIVNTQADVFIKEIIITCNIPDVDILNSESLPIRVIKNDFPKGFGDNHNAAFQYCTSRYFCVLNPDIRLRHNPFPELLRAIKSSGSAIVAPAVVNLQGRIEDSARPFPSLGSILNKLVGRGEAALYPNSLVPEFPDWVAGMFMLFDSNAYASIKGFDTDYFLYYEDVDICARMKIAGWQVMYCHQTTVVHDARRDSHRKLRYMKWHTMSMLRFFRKFRLGQGSPASLNSTE